MHKARNNNPHSTASLNRTNPLLHKQKAKRQQILIDRVVCLPTIATRRQGCMASRRYGRMQPLQARQHRSDHTAPLKRCGDAMPREGLGSESASIQGVRSTDASRSGSGFTSTLSCGSSPAPPMPPPEARRSAPALPPPQLRPLPPAGPPCLPTAAPDIPVQLGCHRCLGRAR